MGMSDTKSIVESLRSAADGLEIVIGPMTGNLLREAADQIVADAERIRQLEARSSTLEDAAFHFLTCRTCAEDGEQSCPDGRQFDAFLRGEVPHGSD